MLGKAFETLKSKTGLDLNPTQILSDIKSKKDALSEMTFEITTRERERIFEKVVETLLKGEELGNDADKIRERVRARLFDQKDGDRLFFDNLKYINEVLLGSLPKSFEELTSFRTTLAHKLVNDARGEVASSERDAPGRSRSGNRRRGNRRPNHHRRDSVDGGASNTRTQEGHFSASKQSGRPEASTMNQDPVTPAAPSANSNSEGNA